MEFTFGCSFLFIIVWVVFYQTRVDYWQPLSLSDSVTEWRLINVIDVTLACEDANSKHVEVFTVAYVDEDCVGNSLLQIWKLRVGELCSDFEHKIWSIF